MNRKLKFRCWNIEEKRWINTAYLECANHDDDYHSAELVNLFDYDNPQNNVIQQFTGLLDIEGKEIYEGDIVSGSFKDTDYMAWFDKIAPVVYRDENAGFNLSSENWDKTTIKVIGNIFEHKHLLK